MSLDNIFSIFPLFSCKGGQLVSDWRIWTSDSLPRVNAWKSAGDPKHLFLFHQLCRGSVGQIQRRLPLISSRWLSSNHLVQNIMTLYPTMNVFQCNNELGQHSSMCASYTRVKNLIFIAKGLALRLIFKINWLDLPLVEMLVNVLQCQIPLNLFHSSLQQILQVKSLKCFTLLGLEDVCKNFNINRYENILIRIQRCSSLCPLRTM